MKEKAEVRCQINNQIVTGELPDVAEIFTESYILHETQKAVVEMEDIVNRGFEGSSNSLRAKANRANSWINMASADRSTSALFRYEVYEFSGKAYAVRK